MSSISIDTIRICLSQFLCYLCAKFTKTALYCIIIMINDVEPQYQRRSIRYEESNDDGDEPWSSALYRRCPCREAQLANKEARDEFRVE